MSDYAAIEKEARVFTEECVTNNRVDPTLFAQYNIKRGLRDQDGKGVLAGITNISRIDAFEERDGKKVPCDGKLWYRGYNVYDLIRGLRGKRYAFEEAAYLLLLGDLAARNAAAPVVLPIGAITSFLGAPLFLYLLFKGRNRP